MKKFIFSLFAMVGLVLVTKAAQPRVDNFLGSQISSLNVSNTLSITNLSALGVTGTNVHNIVYTNSAGTQVTVGTNTESKHLVVDVPIYHLQSLQPSINSAPYTNALSTGDIVISCVGGSGANTATAWVLAPLYKDDVGNAVQLSGDNWSFTTTPTTTTTLNVKTNVPIHRWPGAWGLRIVSITAGDTDASSAVTLNSVTLNSVVP